MPSRQSRVSWVSVTTFSCSSSVVTSSGVAANARELEKRLRNAGFDVRALYYPDARHELLNEINRDEVTADVVAWLDEVIAT